MDRGEFDALLLKPLDSQFSSTMSIVSYANLIRAFIGLILIIIWLIIKHYAVTFIQIIFFSFYIGVGVITLYSVWLLFISILIWYPNLNNMAEFLYTLNGLARYPGEMIRNSGKIVLYILLPISLSISTPIKILLHKNPQEDIITISLVCLTLFIIARIFWKRSLKFYTSAS
jgi:ABC-2 type transport system permease protein